MEVILNCKLSVGCIVKHEASYELSLNVCSFKICTGHFVAYDDIYVCCEHVRSGTGPVYGVFCSVFLSHDVDG